VHEEVRQHVASLAGTEAFKRSARERHKVEMLFAHLKRHLNFRRLRLRGMTGARDDCTLAVVAQNLRIRSAEAGPCHMRRSGRSRCLSKRRLFHRHSRLLHQN
jgi:DDE family transposase